VITRDSQRQRRQGSQKPFSDGYLSGMPPKRRKLIAAAKPSGEPLPQAISGNFFSHLHLNSNYKSFNCVLATEKIYFRAKRVKP